MKILGLDPGIGRVGWGVITLNSTKPILIEYGCFETLKTDHENLRLEQIHLFFTELLSRHSPHIVAIEQIFFAANAKTALSVGQARGVLLLTSSLAKIPTVSYTPSQVKVAVTGYGKADKRQVQNMVKDIFELEELPKPDDAADALAIALTHSYSL